MLQKVRYRPQDLVRKRLIRYSAGQRHCAHERAKSQDRSRSRRALVLARQHPNNQLKISLDLLRGKRASPLIAASDLGRQCAESTARPWILAVYIAQVVVHKICER